MPFSNKKQAKENQRGALDKGLTIALRVLAVILAIAILLGALCALVWFDVVKIEPIRKMLVATENETETVCTTEVDTEETTEQSSDVPTEPPIEEDKRPLVDPVKIEEFFKKYTSSSQELPAEEVTLRSESDVYYDFIARGLTTNEGTLNVLADYDENGNLISGDKIISGDSEEKHPLYYSFYKENDRVWMVFEINGVVMANCFAYDDYESDDRSCCILTEDADSKIISYDNETKKFYINILNSDIAKVEFVERIDSTTLSAWTSEGGADYE